MPTAVRNPQLRAHRELMILRVAVVHRASFAFAAVKIVY